MRTVNTYYLNKEELNSFIYSNDIPNSHNVLLQIFTGVCDEDFINMLVLEIKTLLPHIKIIGSTTDGEIKDSNVSDNKTVLSFTIFTNTTISIITQKKKDNSFRTGELLIEKITHLDDARLAIVFTRGLDTNGELFLNAFNEFAPNLIVSGGMAGDNAQFVNTYIFTEDGFCDDNAVGAILYNPDLVVTTTFNFGWEVISKEFTVTKSVENRVYTIDDVTPVQLYKKYLGDNIEKELPATGIEFPLILKRGDKMVARAVVATSDDGSLIFAGNINSGDKVYLGYGNVEHILGHTSDVYSSLIEYPIESIFIYSCMARRRLLGQEIIHEIAPMNRIAPVSGFFTYGEFFHEEKNKLLNQTMTILAMSEDSKKMVADESELILKNVSQTHTIEALSHLINQTTKELQELNHNLEAKVKEEVEKNRQKDKHLFQQSRLAQMGEMISMIAHQWRQPLAAIKSTSAGINLKAKLGKIDTEFIVEQTDKISSYTSHLSDTIDDFREFFKPNKEKRDATFKEIINSVLDIIGISLQNKKIEVIVNIQSDSKFHSYPNEVKQVILNLFKNAEDVLLENEIANPYIEISVYDEKQYVVMQLKDNGGGISEEIIDDIFLPYFTTKQEKDGTGLGLYMSKKIIEEHCHGFLNVSNDNDGAVFRIALERLEEHA